MSPSLSQAIGLLSHTLLAANADATPNDLTSEALSKCALLLSNPAPSLSALMASGQDLRECIDAARAELESKMMQLVADSRKEPRLPINIRLMPRVRADGLRSTYLGWRALGDASRPVDPMALMAKASVAQTLKFNALNVRLEQLVLNHAVLQYLRNALLQQGLAR